MGWACNRTSKDWKFYFLPSITPKSWQKHQFLSHSNNLADFNNVNEEFLPKNPPKKILQKDSSKKRETKKIPERSKKYLKISNSLHRTWRPKILSSLFYLHFPDYMGHDSNKEFWKSTHFKNMTDGFLLRYQNLLQYFTSEMMHFQAWKNKYLSNNMS